MKNRLTEGKDTEETIWVVPCRDLLGLCAPEFGDVSATEHTHTHTHPPTTNT